jgi:hypothetical protein
MALFRSTFGDAKVSAYVHDRDGKMRRLIQELWDKPEILDRKDTTKSFH